MKLPNKYGSVTKLSGKRRNPYVVRKTIGFDYDEVKDKFVQKYEIIAYAKTKAEGLKLLSEYNRRPYDLKAAKMTFSEVYDKWSVEKYPKISVKTADGYRFAYKKCTALYDNVFKDIKTADLQYVLDNTDSGIATIKKIRILFNLLYKYALKNDICFKNYSAFLEIPKKGEPDMKKIKRFSEEEIQTLWNHTEDETCMIILMLIYNGVRISEFLELKKCDVHLNEQFFEVKKSKTVSGIRNVPIANTLVPFYEHFMEKDSEYLIPSPTGGQYLYENFSKRQFKPFIESLNIDKTLHCCRHTFISLMTEAGIDQRVLKFIVGHSQSGVTESVYTHIDIQIFIDAVNKII